MPFCAKSELPSDGEETVRRGGGEVPVIPLEGSILLLFRWNTGLPPWAGNKWKNKIKMKQAERNKGERLSELIAVCPAMYPRNDFSEPPRTPQESWQQEMQLLRRTVEDGFSKQLTILNDLRTQGIHREPRLRPTFAHSNTEMEVTMHHTDVPQHLVPQLTRLRIHWSYHVLPLAH